LTYVDNVPQPLTVGGVDSFKLNLKQPRLQAKPQSKTDDDSGATIVTANVCGSDTAGSAYNCSYNGRCSAGACVCSSGWLGAYCQQLDLLPATNKSGFNQVHQAPFISTWGGSVIYDKKTQLYHMYASEISRHCGIHRWVSNSIVVHATSAGASDGWAFQRKSQVRCCSCCC